MITPITIVGIFTALIIIVIMSVSILQFGKLISSTEDKQDRIGKRTDPTDAPQRHARYFVIFFMTTFLIGVTLVITSDYIRWVIIGTVLIFSALLFSGIMLMWSMKIFTEMKKNERELKGSLVA